MLPLFLCLIKHKKSQIDSRKPDHFEVLIHAPMSLIITAPVKHSFWIPALATICFKYLRMPFSICIVANALEPKMIFDLFSRKYLDFENLKRTPIRLQMTIFLKIDGNVPLTTKILTMSKKLFH